MYDDRWQMVGAFWDSNPTPKESFVYHAAGNAGLGRSALRADFDGTDASIPPAVSGSESKQLRIQPILVQIVILRGISLKYVRVL